MTTNPTQPQGIAELLDALQRATAMREGVQEAKAAALSFVAGLEERESLRLAGISTAALGYWKEGDSIHPDYDTVALRDVAKLYAEYVTRTNERDSYKADAERYRYMRDNPADHGLLAADVKYWSEEYDSTAKINVLNDTELDKAIDAAIAQRGGNDA